MTQAFCEDHLPSDKMSRVVGHCERYQQLGAEHPKQACYVICSAKCIHQATKDGDLPEGAIATTGIVATTGTGDGWKGDGGTLKTIICCF